MPTGVYLREPRTAPYGDYQRRWREANREHISSRNKGSYQRRKIANPEALLEANHKAQCKKRGITPEKYRELLVSQHGRCAICGSTEPGNNAKYFCIDHNHKTGKSRGLLCFSCNFGIGNLKDNIETLQSAVEYLSSYTESTDSQQIEDNLPKGQYDRTKTKAQRDAEKKGAAPKAEKVGKRAYTKRAKAPEVEAASEATPTLTGRGIVKEARDTFADTQLFNILAGSLPSLKGSSLEAVVITKLGAVIERLEPSPKAVEKVEKVEKKAAKVEVDAAPAPFIPPAQSAVPAPMPYVAPVPFNGSNPQ